MRKFWHVYQELCQVVKKGRNRDVAFIGTEATASKKESLAKSDVQHGKRDKTVRAFEIDTGAASISEREIAYGIFDSTHWQPYYRNTQASHSGSDEKYGEGEQIFVCPSQISFSAFHFKI